MTDSAIRVITRFEMAGRQALRPARTVPAVGLVAAPDPAGTDLHRIRRLHDRLAAPHGWSSLRWSDDRWSRFLQHPGLHHWCVQRHGTDIGWGCLRRHSPVEIEIDSFGLVPEAIGHGYGGHALTLLALEAWRRTGSSGTLWLTTTDGDHPHAEPNYRARGFSFAATWTPLSPRR